MIQNKNRPSQSRPGNTVCGCGRGFASAFDNRCAYCREEEIRRLKRQRRPYKHLRRTA